MVVLEHSEDGVQELAHHGAGADLLGLRGELLSQTRRKILG